LEERGILEEHEDYLGLEEDDIDDEDMYDDFVPGVLVPEEGYQPK